MEEEVKEWKDGYFVSSLGKIYGKKGGVLKTHKGKTGLLSVTIYLEHRITTKPVARIVAETYVPNPKNLSHVVFINGNKDDCRASNLRWVCEDVAYCTRYNKDDIK